MTVLAVLIAIAISVLPAGSGIAMAQETSRSASGQSAFFSASDLTSRERSSLQRQYQHEIRNKDMLLVPRPAKPEAGEEEKLYRYFGVAAGLRQDGRYEEAVEILQYILDKNPDDDYVRAYLERVREEMQEQKKEWTEESAKKALFFKEKKIEDLARDGISYYKKGDFDTALLKFSDVLSLDADNQTAKEYMAKLKKFYFKEIKMERLAEGRVEPVKGLVATEEMEYIALDKKATKLLNLAELDTRIEKTIATLKEEERRSRQITLGPGDVVRISILDHPELSGDVSVQLKGEVILPLVNDLIIAQGLTMEELAEKVTEAMERYVHDPRVSVAIVDYKSKEFYIIDEISCTPFPITRADLTLRDALFISDWGANRALGRVLVMKPSKREPIVKKVDAFDLIYRGNLENNIRIEDGDVIYVPMTYAAKVTQTIADFLGPFRAVRTARDHYLSLKSSEHEWRDIFRLPKTYDLQAEDSKDVRFDNDLNLRNVIIRR